MRRNLDTSRCRNGCGSQPATYPAAVRTAVESRSPEVRFSKNAAMQRNDDGWSVAELAARFEREVLPLREPLFRLFEVA